MSNLFAPLSVTYWRVTSLRLCLCLSQLCMHLCQPPFLWSHRKKPYKAYAFFCKALYRHHTAASFEQAEVPAAAAYVSMMMVFQRGLLCACVSPFDVQHVGISELKSTIGSQLSMQSQCNSTHLGVLRKSFAHNRTIVNCSHID